MFSNARDVTIEWGDCDPAGIVFYPRYFAMFDASTAALFVAALGIGKREILERFEVIGFPMIETRAKFYRPSRFGDRVKIETQIARVGRSSFDIAHRLLLASGELGIEAWDSRVWTARDSNHPSGISAKPIPPEVLSRLTNHSETELK